MREWAVEYDSLYITTGPVFQNTDSTIGANEVTIPSHYYKSILIYNDSIRQSIGFLLPHEKTSQSIFEFTVSIDSLERFTNINFYPAIPDRLEGNIESRVNLEYWND